VLKGVKMVVPAPLCCTEPMGPDVVLAQLLITPLKISM